MAERLPPDEYRAKLAKRRQERAIEAKRALELRAQGKTLYETATALGIGLTRARRVLSEALAAVPVDAANALRDVEGAKVAWLWRAAKKNVEAAEPGVPRAAAIGAALKVCEQQAKLFGLNAPEKQVITASHKHTHALEPTPEATAALVAAEIRNNPAFREALAAETARLDALERPATAVMTQETSPPSLPVVNDHMGIDRGDV